MLLTTPESLSLLLSYENAKQTLSSIQMVIVDEWHELLGSKRGVLLELSLARLKIYSPSLQIWGLTATVGNLEEAARVCVGVDRDPVLVTAKMPREVIIEPILPESIEKLPWAGFLGVKMLPYVLKYLDPKRQTLLFTNTRSQAERWFQALLEARPAWSELIAVHHSSMDKARRLEVEEKLKAGLLRFVVCTSALDLGIDLPSVEQVIQIGSAKSVARLIQRAGRSSHRPLTPCHILLVPTHALQILEIKAYKKALKEHIIEARFPLKKCYDVLLQHLVTCAIGGGIEKQAFYEEIKTTACFARMPPEDYEACIEFLMHGGALSAYPEYKKLVLREGLLKVEDSHIIRRHRMHIGTILSDSSVVIKLMKGRSLGTVEESFLTQLNPGDNFLFSGKLLKLMHYRDLTAHVRLTKESKTKTAVWGGTGLPFSAPLGDVLRRALGPAEASSEDALLKEICLIQQTGSHLPQEDELLLEIVKSREGYHLFVFPFEGKTLHEGLALLIAHRLLKAAPSTLIMSTNDYGLELLSKRPFDESLLNNQLFCSRRCEEELTHLINLHETGKAAFREIARIVGLVFQGLPLKHKSNRQLQMSTGLLYEVLSKYDPDNLLLKQAKKETLDKFLAHTHLLNVLKRLEKAKLILTHPARFTPFSLPLFVERVSNKLSTESVLKRVETILKSWHKR